MRRLVGHVCFEMIKINELYNYIGRGRYVIVDLRDKEDYAKGHILEAINLPYESTKNLKQQLIGYQQIFLYCYTGTRSLLAARDLQNINGKIYDLGGGIAAWKGKLVK